MKAKDNTTKVAVVILNWNGRYMLERFLPTVCRYSNEDAEVIVADNGSTDDSLEWLAAHQPHVKVIKLDKNYGFAQGYNEALKQVDATYYVLLNSDVEVTHHWLTPMVEHLDNYPDVAACQPKLLAEQNKAFFEYAGACGGFIDALGYPYCRGRIFETVEKDNGQYDYLQEIHWATGACMIVRAVDYWTVGGLDSSFFAHNEEIDLCWRLRLSGKKIVCCTDSAVYHVGGGTLPKGNPMKTYLNFRNNLAMLYKNLPEKDLKRVMRMRCFLDYVAATQMVLTGHWADAKAVWKGRRDFSRRKKDLRSERARIQQQSKTQETICAPYSILWQYYIKGIKRFADLPGEK